MATTRTKADLAENVMRDLGLIAADESPSALDQKYVIGRYDDLLAEMTDDDMGYWDAGAIPLEIFSPLTKFVALEVAMAFGVSGTAENIDNARNIYLRRIRRHTQKKSSRLPTEVEDF